MLFGAEVVVKSPHHKFALQGLTQRSLEPLYVLSIALGTGGARAIRRRHKVIPDLRHDGVESEAERISRSQTVGVAILVRQKDRPEARRGGDSIAGHGI